MIIAIPATEEQILCPHFGHAPFFAIISADESTHEITSIALLKPEIGGHDALPPWLLSLGVHIVIAGGIGKPAIENLQTHQIKVVCGSYEHPVMQVVTQYLSGDLLTSPRECNHGSEHTHGHPGECS